MNRKKETAVQWFYQKDLTSYDMKLHSEAHL